MAKNSEAAYRIKHLRGSLGESQSQFALRFRGRDGKPLKAQSVSNWERGENDPGAANYLRMGNDSLTSEGRLWFWKQAGVDTTLIEGSYKPIRIAAKGSKRCG